MAAHGSQTIQALDLPRSSRSVSPTRYTRPFASVTSRLVIGVDIVAFLSSIGGSLGLRRLPKTGRCPAGRLACPSSTCRDVFHGLDSLDPLAGLRIPTRSTRRRDPTDPWRRTPSQHCIRYEVGNSLFHSVAYVTTLVEGSRRVILRRASADRLARGDVSKCIQMSGTRSA